MIHLHDSAPCGHLPICASEGAALHQLGRYEEAAKDFGLVVEKNGLDIQPFWLRYALQLFATGRRQEALGIARRVANKFDLEPEVRFFSG